MVSLCSWRQTVKLDVYIDVVQGNNLHSNANAAKKLQDSINRSSWVS